MLAWQIWNAGKLVAIIGEFPPREGLPSVICAQATLFGICEYQDGDIRLLGSRDSGLL